MVNESIHNFEMGDEQIVRVKGNIDFTNSDDFCEALSRAIEKGPKVVVDLSEAESLDSSAIVSLYGACQKAQGNGISLSLPGASESVIRILQMSGLASTFGLALVRLETDRQPVDERDMQKQDWRITESVILADLDLIISLRDLAITAAVDAGLGAEAVNDVRVAATEALANAFQHGSPEPGKSKITLRCLSCPKALVVEVLDEGPGVTEEQVVSICKSQSKGGLGMRLMLAAMDDVEFSRNERGSRVRMLKWIGED